MQSGSDVAAAGIIQPAADMAADDMAGTKASRFWHSDGRNGPTDSTNSLSVLMNWFTTDGNYSRWRGGDKITIATSIVNMIHEQVGVSRTKKQVINKITSIESDYRSASDWLGATGSGVDCQIQIRDYVMKLCPFFYDLQDVMEDRASTKPLFSSGCEIEREDEDDVLVEQEGSGEEIADRLF